MKFGFRNYTPLVTERADEFKLEVQRKESLLTAFDAYEQSTRHILRSIRRAHGDRVIRGGAVVTKIEGNHLDLLRENGEQIKSFKITKAIKRHIRVNDYLLLVAETRNGDWYFAKIDGIASVFEGEPEERKVHV